jgi:streptogramin lyase
MRNPASTLSSLSAFSVLLFAICASVSLTGCGSSFSATPSLSTTSLSGIQGSVYGGQQPVNLSHVYVFAAGTGGYGGASQSLLTSVTTGSFPTTPDANGNYYVTTNARGFFKLTGEYTCMAGQQVYIYAVGGDTGGGSNSGMGLMAVFGTCPSSGSFASIINTVQINELTTVATAYALAGFATDATHIADDEAVTTNPYASLAKMGMANAFTNASNLVNISTGAANSTTPGGNGTVPSSIITTLGDILASCVNSADTTSGTTVSHSGACNHLFGTATSDGTSTGTQPTDTATAAIYIAQHPGANTADLYSYVQTFPPFAAANAQPNDFSLYITYTNPAFTALVNLAVDASGDVWIVDANNAIIELNPLGVPVTGSPFTAGGLDSPIGIAIDKSGNAWITNGGNGTTSNGSVTELNSSGTPTSISPITGNGIDAPASISIDGLNQIWVANQASSGGSGDIIAFSNSGTLLSYGPVPADVPIAIANDGAGNFWYANLFNNLAYVYQVSPSCTPALIQATGSFNVPYGIAFDKNGHSWTANLGDNSLTEMSQSSCETGGTLQTYYNFTGGHLNGPIANILDGSGNIWLANYYGSSLSEFTNDGVAVTSPAPLGAQILNDPDFIAADGSGDLWVPNTGNNTVTEFIGLATPVITPIAAGLPSTLNTTGVSNLATRP